jgi:indolepyruvate ferredoxin oxidoreductase
VLITGVGGTGVVTVGQVLAMAAHLEGRGASILDFTGFAQKFGPVLGYLRLAPDPADLAQVRIDRGAADALIGGDLVVTTAPKASACLRPGTRAVVSTTAMPTGDIVRRRDASLDLPQRLKALEAAVGAPVGAIDAGAIAERHMGEQLFANMVLAGFAWQSGLLPLGLAAIHRAIELNGAAVAANQRAFALGRLAAVDPARLIPPAPAPETLAQRIDRFAGVLTAYQDAALAARFRTALAPILALGDAELSEAAARGLFRLMYVKDEYEVARLHRDPAFRATLGPGARTYHLAPPLLPGRDAQGRPRKRRFPAWLADPLFAVLARARGLRGTWADPFRHHPDRRAEAADLAWYLGLLDRAAREAGADLPRWRAVLAQGDEIRGYGPVRRAAAVRARAEVARLLG